MNPLVHIQNLSKIFGKQEVLKNLSLRAMPGQCLLLLGKNGVGKSTLFNCIMDLIPIDSGEIRICEMTYANQSVAIKRLLGVVSEENPLIPEFTGWQHLEFVGLLHQIPPQELQTRIETVFDFFFENRTDLKKTIATYSTGMRKKLALCAAVLHRPTILILDEPFSGLDVFAARQVIQFLNYYLSDNRLILVSSHDMAYANQVATHVAVLHEKTIIFSDTLLAFTQNGRTHIDESLFQMLSSAEETDMSTLNWMKEK